jgi:hypothetical protein
MPTACHDEHVVGVVTQGPGPCCKTMPAGAPHVGERWTATDKHGKCFVCEIALSTAKNAAAGQLKIKRGKSLGLCPTSAHRCCKLLAAA